MSSNKVGKDMENGLKKEDDKGKNSRVKNSKSKSRNTKEEKTTGKFSNDPVELLFN